jgi:hypothetical protein
MADKEQKSNGNREQLRSVRIRTGGVHYNGARIVTMLTTDDTAVNIAGSNVIVCKLITTHPAGVYFESSEGGGGTHIIPYANVEVMTVE